MRNHYIVCGYGEIGGAICNELKKQQLQFVVVTAEEGSADSVIREGYALVRGNPTADSSLKEARVDHAFGVIAVLNDDSDNLFISLAARELNPKIFIIARGEDPGLEDRMLRAGADIVVSPMKLGGRQIAELVKQQASAKIPGTLSQSSVMGLRLTVYRQSDESEIELAEILKETGAVGAAGIHRSDGSFQYSPSPDSLVQPEEVVVLVAKCAEDETSLQRRDTEKTILLADDHRALRLLFARKLASAGHEVIQASTGQEALTKAHANAPDLIVLDVNMPLRDGYEVCAELRKTEQFADVPIILYSGEETEEFIRRGRQSGASLCLRKSSKSSELLKGIEEVFAQANQRVQDDDLSAAAQIAAAQNAGKEVSNGSSLQAGSQPGVSYFDLEKALDNVDGDHALLSELIVAVLEETPLIMQRLNTAVSRMDLQKVRLEAHSLKSSLDVVGGCDAAQAAAKLESAAVVDPEKEQIQSMYDHLESEIEKLFAALEVHQMQATSSSSG